jgi:hypothetical protein
VCASAAAVQLCLRAFVATAQPVPAGWQASQWPPVQVAPQCAQERAAASAPLSHLAARQLLEAAAAAAGFAGGAGAVLPACSSQRGSAAAVCCEEPYSFSGCEGQALQQGVSRASARHRMLFPVRGWLQAGVGAAAAWLARAWLNGACVQ